MEITKREKIGLIILSGIIIFVASFFYIKKEKSSKIQVISKSNKNAILEKEENNGKAIYVYICGEVKNPNVYILKEGDRMMQLIEMAGGFKEAADIYSVNLAEKLRDEQRVIIPSKISIQGKAGINPFSGISVSNNNLININTATKEQLKTLPRIGDAYAERIIEYREKNGYFKDIKDIKKVSGIGEKMFENLKDKITVH